MYVYVKTLDELWSAFIKILSSSDGVLCILNCVVKIRKGLKMISIWLLAQKEEKQGLAVFGSNFL